MPQSDPNKALPLIAMGPTSRFIGEVYKKAGKEALAASSPAVKKVASKIGGLASKLTKTKPKVTNTEMSDEAITNLGKASVVGASTAVAALPFVKDEQIERLKKNNKPSLPPKMQPPSEALGNAVKESLATFSSKQPNFEAFNQELQRMDQKLKPKMIGKPSPRKQFTGLGRASMKANPTLRQGE